MSRTVLDLARSVQTLAEENPAKKAGCMYIKQSTHTEPCCIVGHAFINDGHDPKAILDLGSMRARYAAVKLGYTDCSGNVHAGPSDYPAKEKLALTFLYSIQMKQDAGYSWGESLEYTKRMMNNESFPWEDTHHG